MASSACELAHLLAPSPLSSHRGLHRELCGEQVWQNAVVPAWLYKLELQRGASVSLSAMERNVLRVYFGWEVANLFLGGVMASSHVR